MKLVLSRAQIVLKLLNSSGKDTERRPDVFLNEAEWKQILVIIHNYSSMQTVKPFR